MVLYPFLAARSLGPKARARPFANLPLKIKIGSPAVKTYASNEKCEAGVPGQAHNMFILKKLNHDPIKYIFGGAAASNFLLASFSIPFLTLARRSR